MPHAARARCGPVIALPQQWTIKEQQGPNMAERELRDLWFDQFPSFLSTYWLEVVMTLWIEEMF